MASKLKLTNENGKVLELSSGSITLDKQIDPKDFKYIRDTVKDMLDLNDKLEDGDVVFLKGYHTVNDGGGGTFVYNQLGSKSDHNGGTVIDMSKVFPADWSNQDSLNTWFNTINSGTGVIERIFDGSVYVKWFGENISKVFSLSFNSINLTNNYIYEIMDTLFVHSNTIVEGNNATIKQSADPKNFTNSLIVNKNYNDNNGDYNIVIKNLHLESDNETPISSDMVTSDNYGIGGILFQYCTDILLENITFKNGWSGIVISGKRNGYSTEFNIKINKCSVINASSWKTNNNNGVPRGFSITTPSTILTDCSTLLCATGFYCSGDSIKINNCTASKWTYDNGYYLLIPNGSVNNCQAISNNYGNGFSIAYNYNVTINNCIAKNCQNMGFRVHAPQHNININNCIAENCGYGLRSENTINFSANLSSSSGIVTIDLGIDVLTNTLFKEDGYIYIDGATNSDYNGLYKIDTISGNTITCYNGNVSDSTDTATVYYVLYNADISNIIIKNSKVNGVEINKSTNINISNANILTTNNIGINCTNSNNINISNCYINKTVNQAVYIKNCKHINVVNNNIDNCRSSTETLSNNGCINLIISDKINISNNIISSPKYWSILEYVNFECTNSIISNNISKNPDLIRGNTNLYITKGVGSPEGVVYGVVGSEYINTSGTYGSVKYIKESGNGTNTGWVKVNSQFNSNSIYMNNLPTADPSVAGQLYTDSNNNIKVSQG